MIAATLPALRQLARYLFSFSLIGLTLPFLLGTADREHVGAPSAHLAHVPTGTALLSWSQLQGGTLTITLSLIGLAPTSTHPAQLRAGTCMATPGILYRLHPVVANATGQGTSQTRLTGLATGIPAGVLTVLNGPTETPSSQPWHDQSLRLACGAVARQSTNENQAIHESVSLGSSSGADQQVTGTVSMTQDHGTLVITLTVAHLQPDSHHVAHIHHGSCASQGAVLYDLQTLRANGAGDATSTTRIAGVTSIPQGDWYVNVHLAPTMADLATQTGFTPIACGDIALTPATR